MRTHQFAIVMTGFALLAGCGANDSAEGPGGVTAGEARALNDAAAMLDARTENSVAAQTDEPEPEANTANPGS